MMTSMSKAKSKNKGKSKSINTIAHAATSSDSHHHHHHSHSHNHPPFLPLEETGVGVGVASVVPTTHQGQGSSTISTAATKSPSDSPSIKRLLGIFFGAIMLFLLYDAMVRPPEQRFIKPDASDRFLRWVQVHPLRGMVAFVLVIASAVVLLIPVGTPLTIGCGFVYKSAYGWKLGFFVATIVSMFGSAAGAVSCFLLGRYLMRDHVRTWIRKYPLFVAIDIAAAEHGLKILAMLYLTPIAPLGPLSYMSGTTSMQLSHFALAKIASLPIMMLYVFIGASAGALVAASSRDSSNTQQQGGHLEDNAKALEENPAFLMFGIIISVVMISTISMYIKKELFKILERQKKVMERTDHNHNSDHDLNVWDVEGGVSSSGEDEGGDIHSIDMQDGNHANNTTTSMGLIQPTEMLTTGHSPAPRQRHRHFSTDGTAAAANTTASSSSAAAAAAANTTSAAATAGTEGKSV